MSIEERLGSPVRDSEMQEIVHCMMICGVQDIKSLDNYFTWNNKPQGNSRVFSKLDRMLVNQACMGIFPSVRVSF